MVAQAKGFIIDKAMLSLIISFLGAGVICGKLLYQVNELNESQKTMQAQMLGMAKETNLMALALLALQKDVGHMEENVGKLTEGINAHIIGHPVRITR